MDKCKQNIILFDLDGTLTDSMEGVIRSVQYMQEKKGMKVWDFDDLRFIVGPPLFESFTKELAMLPEEAEALCFEVAKMPHLKLRGFMTMAPKCQNDAEYEKYFTETYNLIIDIWKKKLYNIERPIISMGMSGSFEAAVRCGSTCVRVGSLLFAE